MYNPFTFRISIASLLFTTLALAGEPIGVDPKITSVVSMAESRLDLYGWIETGITANFDSPNDRQNFGRLLDDRSNEPLLNQLVIGAERHLDPKMADRFDIGFKLQLFYGSDARYLHSTGLLDLTTNDTIQPDIPEAWILAHFPLTGTNAGLDLLVGKYGACRGPEMSDPRMSPFYSHSYIFNFGAPFNDTGVLATLHATPGFEICAGVNRGVNVTLDDPNDSASFCFGINGQFNDGRFAYMAITHLGPENPGDNHDFRYLNELTLTWKATDKLTAITDLNYVYEEAFDAQGYGVAQYFTYAINHWLTGGIRGEVWRDADGFFVAQFASNNDFIHFARGDDTVFDSRTVGGGRTTYGAITFGVTIKPAVPKPLAGLMIRPELRYDRALNGRRPFNDSSDRGMLTAGIDLIFSF